MMRVWCVLCMTLCVFEMWLCVVDDVYFFYYYVPDSPVVPVEGKTQTHTTNESSSIFLNKKNERTVYISASQGTPLEPVNAALSFSGYAIDTL